MAERDDCLRRGLGGIDCCKLKLLTFYMRQ